jgi:hypothetical protein
MTFIRTLFADLLLPFMVFIVLTLLLDAYTLSSIRQQFASGNTQQSKNIDTMMEAADLSDQIARIHLSVKNSLKSALDGKLTNEQLYRVHTNAVNSLNKITERINNLSRSSQIQEASPQDGQLLQDHFEKYKNFVIQLTDISSIDPKSANKFIDMAQNNFNDYSAHAYHIFIISAMHANSLNQANQQNFDTVFNRVVIIKIFGLLFILLLAAFTANITRKSIKA